MGWYRARGMSEDSHYLHVYADSYTDAGEPGEAVEARPGLTPVRVFLHAALEREAEMRARFRRVHVCRRFTRPLPGSSTREPTRGESRDAIAVQRLARGPGRDLRARGWLPLPVAAQRRPTGVRTTRVRGGAQTAGAGARSPGSAVPSSRTVWHQPGMRAREPAASGTPCRYPGRGRARILPLLLAGVPP